MYRVLYMYAVGQPDFRHSTEFTDNLFLPSTKECKPVFLQPKQPTIYLGINANTADFSFKKIVQQASKRYQEFLVSHTFTRIFIGKNGAL